MLSDPIVRLALRHSVGPLRLLPLIPLALFEVDAWPSARLSRLGVGFLCFAAPHAAAYLIEMEQDGRLDQMRLAGRRPMKLAGTAMFFVATPWLLLGLILTALAIAAGRPTSEFGETVVDPRNFRTIAGIGAVAGFATMLAALSTTVPFARERVDPRIGVAALSVLAFAVCLTGVNIISSSRASGSAFVFALLAEAVVIAACMWRLPRRIAHPQVVGGARSDRFRLPAWDWLLQSPGVYRGALLSSSGFVLFGLFAPVVILTRVLMTENTRLSSTMPFYLPPLFIGLIAVSLICREDAISGRLDMMRLSSTRVARTALEMLIGLWAPFVLATLGLAMLTHILLGIAPGNLFMNFLVASLIAPLPLVEGWTRQWPMMMTVPFAAASGLLLGLDSWPTIIPLSAVMWIAVARMLSHPDSPALPGWRGWAASLALSVTPLLLIGKSDPLLTTLALVATLLAVSPVLIVPNARNWTDRWGHFLLILLGVSIAGIWRLGLAGGAYVSVTVLSVWLSAYRIRHWDPSRVLLQAGARLAILVSMAILLETLTGTASEQQRQFAGAAMVLAAATELLHHAGRWTTGLRRRPTLPT